MGLQNEDPKNYVLFDIRTRVRDGEEEAEFYRSPMMLNLMNRSDILPARVYSLNLLRPLNSQLLPQMQLTTNTHRIASATYIPTAAEETADNTRSAGAGPYPTPQHHQQASSDSGAGTSATHHYRQRLERSYNRQHRTSSRRRESETAITEHKRNQRATCKSQIDVPSVYLLTT
jgi:hypothetical protein